MCARWPRRTIAAGLSLAILLLGCSSPTKAGAKVVPTRSGSDQFNGVNLTGYASPDVFSTPMSDQVLTTLRNDGANTVEVNLECWQIDRTSTSIDCDNTAGKGAGQVTISDQSVAHALGTARQLGLKPVLKPIVDSYDDTFRGFFAPADWVAWFGAYRAMMNRYAALAAANDVVMLVVGTELTAAQTCSTGPKPLSAPDCAAQWNQTIDGIRSSYHGMLIYAANWSEKVSDITSFPVWSRMDLVGVDGYYPLANNSANSNLELTVSQLVEGWTNYTEDNGVNHNWIADLDQLHRQYQKPVIFTEVGYQRVKGAAANKPADPTKPANRDAKAQRNAYEAVFRAFASRSWFHGACWWNYQVDRAPANDTDLDPRGTPAEGILRQYWR